MTGTRSLIVIFKITQLSALVSEHSCAHAEVLALALSTYRMRRTHTVRARARAITWVCAHSCSALGADTLRKTNPTATQSCQQESRPIEHSWERFFLAECPIFLSEGIWPLLNAHFVYLCRVDTVEKLTGHPDNRFYLGSPTLYSRKKTMC
jgi:hypothetical protein